MPGEGKEQAAKSLSFTPSGTRAFQGHLVWWQLERRPQPAPCVRPGQEPTAWSWLGLAFVPLALLSLSRRELLPPQRSVPRGRERGTRPAAGRRKGWDTGTPGHGELEGRMEEPKVAEMGWRRGGAAVFSSAPDHIGTTGRSGRGRGAARGGRRSRPSSSPSPS